MKFTPKWSVPIRFCPTSSSPGIPDEWYNTTERSRMPDDEEGDGYRLSVVKMWMGILQTLAARSSCPAGKRHAALLVSLENTILATGYNGPPRGWPHCSPCTLIGDGLGKDWRSCPAVHAEMNAILNAAREGISTRGSILLVTKTPCTACRLLIENAGIRKIFVLWLEELV